MYGAIIGDIAGSTLEFLERKEYDIPLFLKGSDITDDTIEGLCCEEDRVFTIQYHPDTMSGPRGGVGFYEAFIALMKEDK